MLKILDRFLKFLKTDRNTFFTYILTLITAYFVVDRIVEILFMIFTGMSVSYWGPITYTFAMACPVFAFLFSGKSKFNVSEKTQIAFFDVYVVSLYILAMSMFTQWINQFAWLGFLSVPNYPTIVSEFYHLVKPAFSALSIYIPILTFYPVINWLVTKVHDTADLADSITDYTGIDLSDPSVGKGDYTCEVTLCRDTKSGKIIKMYEDKRFFQTLVVGVSGSGKTSLIYEPMIAEDIKKKFFFSNIAKEVGITALKTGLASLDTPYDNDYLNKNFNLNMLTPSENKIDLYNKYLSKMIISNSGGNYTYRNLGITYMCPDIESIERLKTVADSYGFGYNIIDPNDSASLGLNPFAYNDPVQVAVSVSSALKGLITHKSNEIKLSYMEDASIQAVENVVILLKEMYPRLNDGDIPTLEDLQYYLNDFKATEELCERMKIEEDLAKKYTSLIKYFENNFYEKASNKDDLKKYLSTAINQLDSLLRYPGVKNILCNKYNNLNYDNSLKNGDITFVCTRRGDLGKNLYSSFGIFFLLLTQHSVLRRPGSEKSRVPHFLYVDDFAPFISSATEPIFTIYRKYRVAIVLSAQNLSQLGTTYRDTLISNCNNKIIFGNNVPEDNAWWEKELGSKKKWKFSSSYNTDQGSYDPKLMGIEYGVTSFYKDGKIQQLKFKQCIYKLTSSGGKSEVGKGALDFLPAAATKPKKLKEFDFEKYTSGDSSSKGKKKRKNYNLTHINDLTPNDVDPLDDDIPDDIDPISTKSSRFLFDNQDAIVVNLKKKKNNDQ